MYIYKRPNSKFFQYTFNYKGVRYKGSTKQTNKRDAGEWAADRRKQILNESVGNFVYKPPPLFRSFAKEFLETAENRYHDRRSSLISYKSKLKNLLSFPSLSSARLDNIDEELIDRYKTFRRSVVSAASCNHELATLSLVLRLAHERKLINRLPRLKKFPVGPGRTYTLPESLEHELIDACSAPLKELVGLLLDTGLRVGEALSLRPEDVHFAAGEPSRYGYVQVQKGKSKNARRAIPLTARSQAILRRLVGDAGSLWLFPGRTGMEPVLVTSIDHQFRKTCESIRDASGKNLFPREFVLHSLRHTFLTRLGALGVDAFTIMRIAGHSSITVSQKYVHPTPEGIERAIRRMDDAQTEHQNQQSSRSSPHSLPQFLKDAA